MYAITHQATPTLWVVPGHPPEPPSPGEYMREKRGSISYRDLAQRTGLSHSYLRELEAGLRPWKAVSVETLEAIAYGLGVPVEEMIRVVRGQYAPNTTADQDAEVLIRYFGLVSGKERGGTKPPEYRAISEGQAGGYVPGELFLCEVGLQSVVSPAVAQELPVGATVLLHERLKEEPGDFVLAYLPRAGFTVMLEAGSTGFQTLSAYDGSRKPVVLEPGEKLEVRGVMVGWWVSDRRSRRKKSAGV